jgi:hypothetical protein
MCGSWESGFACILKDRRFTPESTDLNKEHNLIIAIHRVWQGR